MLDKQIRKRFQQHIKDGGLITAPEDLLAAVLKEVARWLKEYELEYQIAHGLGAAEALRDLRLHRIKR